MPPGQMSRASCAQVGWLVQGAGLTSFARSRVHTTLHEGLMGSQLETILKVEICHTTQTWVTLAEPQVACPMPIALVDAEVLHNLIAGLPNEAIDHALYLAL
jgi:hypothetical protein